MAFAYSLNDAVILNATNSIAFLVPEDAVQLLVFGPGTLPEQIGVEAEPTKTGTGFIPYFGETGSQIIIPQNAAVRITCAGFRQIRLRVVGGGNVAAARTFKINALSWGMGGV